MLKNKSKFFLKNYILFIKISFKEINKKISIIQLRLFF